MVEKTDAHERSVVGQDWGGGHGYSLCLACATPVDYTSWKEPAEADWTVAGVAVTSITQHTGLIPLCGCKLTSSSFALGSVLSRRLGLRFLWQLFDVS